MLRLHCLQLWYNLSDAAMEEAVHDRLSFQLFLGLDPLTHRLPDDSTVLHFRHFLGKHALAETLREPDLGALEQRGPLLKTGTLVEATIMGEAGST